MNNVCVRAYVHILYAVHSVVHQDMTYNITLILLQLVISVSSSNYSSNINSIDSIDLNTCNNSRSSNSQSNNGKQLVAELVPCSHFFSLSLQIAIFSLKINTELPQRAQKVITFKRS